MVETGPAEYRCNIDQICSTTHCKFETNIPRKGSSRPQFQLPHLCVWERFIYSHDWSATPPILLQYADRSWEYINRSQTHECRDWDWGHAIPFLGILKWDFRCSAPPSSLFSKSSLPWLFSVHAASVILITDNQWKFSVKILKFKTYSEEYPHLGQSKSNDTTGRPILVV